MRNKLLILAFLSLFFGVRPVFAGGAPTLLTPSNNSTTTSSRLEWQTPSYSIYSSNPYRIQVDDDLSFSTLNKDYYTNNTYYTPILSFGTWNWRVKVKDASGVWSDWSVIWSFVLTDSTPSPSAIQPPSLTPTPTPSPTQTPASTPASSTTPSTSSFTISNIPSQINSDQSFNVSVNLALSSNPNTNFYLKGAFRKTDGSNYFGLTKVAGSWVKNSSSYSSQYPIMTDSSGNWSGNLEVKPDSNDSGFIGTGDYLFKVGKYNSLDTSPSVSWSDNESTITITSTESSDQDSTSTSTSNSPLSTTNSPTPSVKAATTISSQPKSSDKLIYHIASVAAATASAIPEVKTEVKNQRQTNPFLVIGLILIFAGIGTVGYIYLKPYAKIHFPWRR